MKEIATEILLLYLGVLSFTGFCMMGIDKRRAVRQAWRIPERNLFLVAFLGGGIGSFLGMYVFHHKTKHIKFVLLMPLAAALYSIFVLKLMNII
jgi:uncharacterized membrane protein YsdA (DUF1294 family)